MKINIRFLRFPRRMRMMPGALSAAAAWAGQPAIPSLDELAGEWPRAADWSDRSWIPLKPRLLKFSSMEV